MHADGGGGDQEIRAQLKIIKIKLTNLIIKKHACITPESQSEYHCSKEFML